jgi:hypothetical protein
LVNKAAPKKESIKERVGSFFKTSQSNKKAMVPTINGIRISIHFPFRMKRKRK